MTALQEYDLEFKPKTIIKGQGLCKLAAESMDYEDNDKRNQLFIHSKPLVFYRSRMCGIMISNTIFSMALLPIILIPKKEGN